MYLHLLLDPHSGQSRSKVGTLESHRFTLRRRRVGLSKYGVIKSGWNKRKDQLPDISRTFASSESRQLPHVHQQRLVRCRESILREALRDRFSSCYRVREDAWNDDLPRCCSWLVAFTALLAWLSIFHAAIGERGSGVIRVPADVVVVLLHYACMCGRAFEWHAMSSHCWSTVL